MFSFKGFQKLISESSGYNAKTQSPKQKRQRSMSPSQSPRQLKRIKLKTESQVKIAKAYRSRLFKRRAQHLKQNKQFDTDVYLSLK